MTLEFVNTLGEIRSLTVKERQSGQRIRPLVTGDIAPFFSPARVTYGIMGFDRVNFVSDIAGIVPQDGSCRISALCFESDGLRATGSLTVQSLNEQRLNGIGERLRSVRGIVDIRQIIL